MDAYTADLYQSENLDSQRTAKAAKKSRIRTRILCKQSNPQKAKKFFTNKFISTWADPTFQSVWIAPYSEKPQTKLLRNIYYSNYSPWSKHPQIKFYQK